MAHRPACMPLHRRPRAAAGVSLVSLLVGLVMGLLAVLAAMALYRGTLRQVYSAGGLVPNAQQDGQLASGLLSAQIALQSAGFGLVDAVSGTHLLLLRDASLASDGRLGGTLLTLGASVSAGSTLLWTSNPALSSSSDAYVCQGLHADPGTRALLLLQTTSPCHPLAQRWNQLVWTGTALVAPQQLAQPVGLRARNAARCWPFGALPQAMTHLEAPAASVQVQLAYTVGIGSVENQYTLCLANLQS